MPQNLNFFGWQRSGIFALSNGTLEDGRLQASVQITLQNRDTPENHTQAVPFLIAGPVDVTGLLPGAITTHMPPPDNANAETTKFVYVEFSAPDVPWRFTPQLAAARSLRPWIVLVVGTREEVQLEANNMVTLSTAVVDAHPLSASARWAHVQENNGQVSSRLLSPRELLPNQEYIAAIVPAFNNAGSDSWAGGAGVTLPCFHSWRFRTTEEGDFKTLAARLNPAVADPALGRAPLSYRRVEPAAELSVRGALAPIGGTDAALPTEVGDDVDQLLTVLLDPRGRPVISLPRYGESWATDPLATTWGSAVNRDPRHRGTAGLGLLAGIELQDEIVDAAATQVGALDIAEQRIRQLTMGLSAVRSLWQRRLPNDLNQRLLLYGPSMRRMVTGTGTVLNAIAGGIRPLAPRLFSSAARRVLRQGPARTGLAKPSATNPTNLLEEANRCPKEPDRVVDGLPHGDSAANAMGFPILDELLGNGPSPDGLKKFILFFLQKVEESEFFDLLSQIYEYVKGNIDHPERLPFAQLIAIIEAIEAKDAELLRRLAEEFKFENEEPDLDSLIEFGDGLVSKPPDRPCRPVDLGKLEEILTATIDPTRPDALVIRRVLDGITGLDPAQPLAPVEICVGLDLPVWTFLRDQAPDWLLPGVNALEKDSVVGMESNPTFVDAFLLGLNTQVLSELRWRNMRIATGCTPMRTFWGQIDLAGNRRMPDIRGIHLWDATSPLGDANHQPPPVTAANDLVLVFRSDLFRRYPNTLVYIAPAPQAGGVPDWDADPPFGGTERLYPTFQGSIGTDITFFRFELQPTDARRYWIVLEEPPSGYTFRNDEPDDPTINDGAAFADHTFSDPIRVLIRGESLVP